VNNNLLEGTKTSLSRKFEWIFASIAALVCVFVPAFFGASQLSIPYATIWDILPFPGLYFIEIATLGIATLISVYSDDHSKRSFWNSVPWISAGIILTFVILGALTIGFFLIPAFISFLVVGIIADRRKSGDIPLHLILLFAASIFQVALVYAVLQIDYSLGRIRFAPIGTPTL
jgi:hypothetical protein